MSEPSASPSLCLVKEPPTPPPEPPLSGSWVNRVEPLGVALLVLALVTVGRLLVASVPGLAADEAYYWVWSQHPDAGYFDHPPLVAWMIRASTEVFGTSELGIRALPVLMGSLAALALAVTSRRPLVTAVVLVAMPLFALGGLLATPDVPLVLGWAVALAAVARGGRWWILAGLAAGVAAMGKHTGFLLFPLLLLGRPGDLRTAYPWLGLLAGGLVVLPNLGWLARNDWITVRFQLGHGFGVGDMGAAGAPGVMGFIEFVAGQVVLVSPVVFACVVAFWAVAWRETGLIRLWWWVSFPVFAFFALASFMARSEPNWPVPAYLGAALGLAHLSARWRRATWMGLGIAVVISAFLTAHAVRPLVAVPRDPMAELGVGRVLGEAVQAWGVEPVYTARYQEASWIRFYGGVHAEVLPGDGRRSQYDLLPRMAPGEAALYVRPWRRSPPRHLDSLFNERTGPNTVVARDVFLRSAGRWQVYDLGGFLGFPGATGEATGR